MASASSSAARLLFRDGKSMASLLFRGRAAVANLTETVQNTGPAIRSLLVLNQTVPSQYPVFAESFPVMKPGLGSCYIQEEEAVSERRGKMEAGQGKRVVDNEGGSSSEEEEEEEETDFDEEEFDDIDMDDDEEFDDTDEEDDDEEVKKNKK